jgi:anti-sigma-K factor RskA
MSRHGDSECDHAIDAGAYVLRALPEGEHAAFATHLRTCASCRHEVQQLQTVADTLPIAAPQLVPPPELKDRIMRVVDAEAELLRAAGPEADRVPERQPRRSRRWGSGLFLRPVAAGAVASVLIAVGVAGGVLLSNDGTSTPATRSLAAKVSTPGASATVALQGDRAALHVTNLPSAPAGKVYQVWIQRPGADPQPTHTLFNVRKSDGSAVVPIEERVREGEKILVTDEPDGGSLTPTGRTVIDASLS